MSSAEQRGREEGKQEGRRERNIEVAQKLLLTGMEIEMISSITELSIEEIQDLKV